MERIVLDTNCLIISLSKKGGFYPVWKDFLEGKYILCLTNEILAEYEEILSLKMGREIASNVIQTILMRKNIEKLEAYYHFGLIQNDWDDNKFVDCAIVANAKYIVTQDRHFDVLEYVQFPKVYVIDIAQFLQDLQKE